MAITRPGVEVVQEFQNAAASLNLPTLPALIVGPGFEVATDVDSGAYAEGAGAPTEFLFQLATTGSIVDLSEPPTLEAEANAHIPIGVSLSNMLLETKSSAVTGAITAGSTTFTDATLNAFSGFDPDASGAPNFWVEISASGTVDAGDVKRHFITGKTDNNNLVLAGDIVATSASVKYRIIEARTLEVIATGDLSSRGITKASTGVSVNPGLVSSDSLVVVEADILLSWRALRVDLAGKLTVFTDTSSIEAVFGVGSIVPGNPGAYAISLAIQNTTTEVNYTGLTEDFYTAEETAFQAALDYVEDKDVYGLSLLTHNTAIHQAANTHATGSSVSTAGRERAVFVNRRIVSVATEIPASGVGTITSAGAGNGLSDSGAVNNAKFLDPTNGTFITDAVGVGYFLEIESYTATAGAQRSVTPDEADFFKTTTVRCGNGAFSLSDVARVILASGATTAGNDIVHTISGVSSDGFTATITIAAAAAELMASATRTWVALVDRTLTIAAADKVDVAGLWTIAGGNFVASDVGRIFHITGTGAGGANDGFYLIASVTSGTVMNTEIVPPAGAEVFAGAEPSKVYDVNREILRDLVSDSVVGATRIWTIRGANFTSADVGRSLKIAGAANAGNNATHVIDEVLSSSTIRTTSATTPVNETFNGLAGSLTTLDVWSVTPNTAEAAYITDTRHKIASIASESQLILVSDPTSGFGGTLDSIKYTVTRDLTRSEEAAFIAGYSSAFASRRTVHTWPDILAVSVNGVATKVPGYYAGAGYIGLTAGLPSQAGFTNMTLTGFVGRENSDDRFSDTQLDTIANGGTMIMTQSVEGGPLATRHQLTTDVSTIYFQEFSVTKNVDLIARFFRSLFAPYVGVYNITGTVIDILKTRGEGGISFLMAARVARVGAPIRRGTLSKIAESAIQPDTVEVEIDVDVPLPLNNVKITILV